VLVHAALAHPRAPENVILYQIACWLQRMAPPERPPSRMRVLDAVLSPDAIAEAELWQRRSWQRFRRAHTPRRVPQKPG
jgi:hypothetical protein